ncbi:hypothetical protein MBOVa_4550 [Mycoplasmopsis bovis 8790]|nr:hypothetical protein MBOVa_4550 [Mycoplasmopsis bovis 8790]
MKTNRKILFGLLTLSSFTAVPLLAAKCYDKNEDARNNNTKETKQTLSEVIKNTNLGEITLTKGAELPESNLIVELLSKTNNFEKDKIDISELEVSNIQKTSAVVSAKKESKKYTGSVNVSFTLKMSEENADKNENAIDKKDLSTVNKDNFKFLTNFLFRTEILEALQKDLSLPNLKYDDFTFTLDKQATNTEIGKVVIEANPDSKLIKGKVILDIPKITKNQRDELGTVKETIEELSFLSDKMDKNITNIDKWETSNSGMAVHLLMKLKLSKKFLKR